MEVLSCRAGELVVHLLDLRLSDFQIEDRLHGGPEDRKQAREADPPS